MKYKSPFQARRRSVRRPDPAAAGHSGDRASGEVPALLAGSEIPLARNPESLSQALADAQLRCVRADHLGVVRQPDFVAAAAGFLCR